MNRPLKNALLATCAACLFANCATTSTPQARIERHPELYAGLPAKQKSAVQSGRLLEGMSKDAVYLAWGRPNGIRQGTSSGKSTEKWRYVGHRPVYTNRVGVGYGYGGYYGCNSGYYDFGHTVDYVPYTAAVVEFRDDEVAGWERER
jgi:outer membrane protein assembly factor BamE (lipoprotein component of BamABCDE complex)